MTHHDLVARIYAAYNRQDADALLELVDEDVDWPDGPDGPGRLHGRAELRAYWLRQWADTHTRDDVAGIDTPAPDRIVVRIDQVVRTPSGTELSAGSFEHRYRLAADGLVARLDIRRL
ncbi:MAG: nuclear transport factor 2 family protein [Gluconacetobacter diazotrophicus]|nr:nuclear transport factor 2 family protein [Gluconacetobacter diazotrophicus]